MPDIGAGRQQACVAVELFSIGYCTAPLATTEQGATWKKRRFPAGVALIRHPFAGNILFDTGYGASFWQATQPFPERIYRWLTPAFLPENEQLRHQLYRLGVEKPDLVFRLICMQIMPAVCLIWRLLHQFMLRVRRWKACNAGGSRH